MTKRVVLTAREIEAVLAVAGNALAPETFEGEDLTEAEQARMVDAYESGMTKLRLMLRRLRLRETPVRPGDPDPA